MLINSPGYKLNFADAVEVHKRLIRGEYQFRIAANYDCNQARINDVKKGRLHPGSRQEALRQLGE